MKKLNRKGFTLVELLAVIIILAIVVGITIPAVLSTVNGAKTKAFHTAAETSADWLERQYQLYTIDSNSDGLNGSWKNSFNSLTAANRQITISDAGIIESAGLKTSNIASIKAYVSTTGRVCVVLTAQQNGDYYGTGTAKDAKASGTQKGTNFEKGGACNGVTFS